jgi:hypothetical protein
MRRKKSNIEKHNDALLFWSTLGPIIYRIVGTILVIGLIAAGFAIKGTIDRHNEHVAAEKQQELTAQRQEIVDRYIENNPKTFGAVTRQWNSGGLFFAESEYGEFTIAFEGTEVTKIFVENKAGQIVTLYERTE